MFVPYLDDLTEESRSVLMELLRCASRHPGRYRIRVRHSASRRLPVTFRFVLDDGAEPCGTLSAVRNFDNLLADRQFFGPHPEHGWDAYVITEGALEWYAQHRTLTDDDLRREIGQHFLAVYDRGNGATEDFDIAGFAAQIKVGPERVQTQTRRLLGSGYLASPIPINRQEFGYLKLSEPKGLQWAMAGFPPVGAFGAPVLDVRLDVQVQVTQFLLDVGGLPISDEQKRDVAEAAQDLQREPTIDKVGRIMELAANTHALVPAVTKLIMDNAPALQRLLQQFPIGS